MPDGARTAAAPPAERTAHLVVAGRWRPLGRLIGTIPAPLANAMLAGVLLRLARRWAIPGAIAAAAIVVAIDPSGRGSGVGLLPMPEWTTPMFEPGVLIGLALPLFIVTMASQNVTGMTVLALLGALAR